MNNAAMEIGGPVTFKGTDGKTHSGRYLGWFSPDYPVHIEREDGRFIFLHRSRVESAEVTPVAETHPQPEQQQQEGGTLRQAAVAAVRIARAASNDRAPQLAAVAKRACR